SEVEAEVCAAAAEIGEPGEVRAVRLKLGHPNIGASKPWRWLEAEWERAFVPTGRNRAGHVGAAFRIRRDGDGVVVRCGALPPRARRCCRPMRRPRKSNKSALSRRV